MTIPRDISGNALFLDMLDDFARASDARERAAALADPVKHKLSKLFKDASYLYFDGGKDGRGRAVRFCWSTHRNAAGYFLAWREVIGKKEGKRDGWMANRRKQTLIDRARKLARASREKGVSK